ncbi:hypothetical protein [Litchfieldia alkalitelluris]|uniref:hypothetical protein n=1 Tax=Litchfieldia alkalitelluris TaxID=304268 RepID=UPI00147609FF|nr:hypothetical protein [Litchfieldia alkalitelluris]
MNELDVMKLTVQKQANRIANLTLDLDLAHSQLEILQAEQEKCKSECKKDGPAE